jgi:hypothetical protein
LFDNDNPGKTSLNKIIDKMSRFYKDEIKLTYTFTPDGYKDLDEYLRDGGNLDNFKETNINISGKR